MWRISSRRVLYLLFVAISLASLSGLGFYLPWTKDGTRLVSSPENKLQGDYHKPRPPPALKETTHPGRTHVYGFTILDQLYLWNGTLYIVTTNTSAFPERRVMIALPVDLGQGLSDEPTDEVSFFDRQRIPIERDDAGTAISHTRRSSGHFGRHCSSLRWPDNDTVRLFAIYARKLLNHSFHHEA